MFVILDGQFQWRGEFGGETIMIPFQAGGRYRDAAISRMKQFTVTGRAVTDVRC